jgi:hypothetical protein
MGYCMTLENCKFEIEKENFSNALSAIIDYASTTPRISWVGIPNLIESRNLIEALDHFRWSPSLDDDGNIDGLEFCGEKLGNDWELFTAIAPFVKKGSFIEMIGEDNAMWRWVFDGKGVREVQPIITWE